MTKPLFAILAVIAFAAVAPPPVHELSSGQVKRSDGIHIGTRSTPVLVEGNLVVTSTDGGFSVTDQGAVTAVSVTAPAVTATGTSALTTVNATTVKSQNVDAGVLLVMGEAAILGTTTITTCTLNAGSPSTCTATVRAGSKCSCTNVGATAAIAALGCAVGLSGTTVTVTSANAANHVVNIHCF